MNPTSLQPQRATFPKTLAVVASFLAITGCGENGEPERRGQPAVVIPVQSDGPAAGRIRAFLEELRPGRYVLVIQTDVFPGTWVDVDLIIGAESVRVAQQGWLAGGELARLDVSLPGPPSMVVRNGGMRTVVSKGDDQLPVTTAIHTYTRKPGPETASPTEPTTAPAP